MEEDTKFKKIFLITMIFSLIISALIGISVFLFGKFGEIEMKLLLTTLTIGGFSLTGLCSSTLYYKNKYLFFSKTGMIMAVVGFIISTCTIWEILNLTNIWKWIIISIILSMSISHSSLLLLIQSRKTNVKFSLALTLLFISIVTIMLITLVLNGFDIDSEIYFKSLGIFAILDILGTLITPILLKVTSMN